MWTCITITCSNTTWAKAIKEETDILSYQNLLNSEFPCLVLPNPEGSVRNGEVTLNALWSSVEMLCNTRGFENITFDVLSDSHILIIHHQQFHRNSSSCYWPNGTVFLPTKYKNKNGSGLQTYLEYVINLCSKMKEAAPASPGVWIVSTDKILSGKIPEYISWPISVSGVLLLSVRCQKKNAEYSDVINARQQDGTVESISSISLVDDKASDLNVDINAGVFYVMSTVAKSLLLLCSKYPLDRCTYLGEDNGSNTLQLSLLYDLLGPLWIKDKCMFISGAISESYDETFNLRNDDEDICKARTMIWDELHRFSLHALRVDGLRLTTPAFLSLEEAINQSDLFPCIDLPLILHSSVRRSKPSLICANSLIEIQLDSENNEKLFVISSSVKTTQSNQILRLVGKAYLINTTLDLDEIPNFSLNDNICMVGYSIRLGKESIGRSAAAIFSAADNPILDFSHSRATVFGLSWSRFFSIKGIEPSDLWESGNGAKCLMTARLFPLTEDASSWQDLLWLQEFDGTLSRLESWRSSRRFSIEDFQQLLDPGTSLRNLRSISTAAILQAIPRWSGSLVPYLRRSCAENWSDSLLSTLDQAARDRNGAYATRALAAIADLLACKAGSERGLRSGPASNKEWVPAFRLLEYSLDDGVIALAAQRAEWMDTPDRLIRTARHYERAVHILIRQTVKSVQTHMVTNKDQSFIEARPPIGTWIEAECPARIDLSGGWSDTPPICYEMGGSVVNVAILVDGEKPIGARGRRIEKPELVLVSEGQTDPLIITSVEEIMTYNNPTAPGALLKAALVCAGVIKEDCQLDLSQQLEKTLGGGLELSCWSKLPQGSGLGTSSILASALLAVIYTAMGYKFNRYHLIHAVLHIEQLLTTGGGWQDQVGGVMGGCNRGHSPADLCLQVHVENIPLSKCTVDLINQRLLLIHTGKVRLARNLLQNVIRQWYARDKTIVATFHQLTENADACKNALLQGNLEEFGRSVNVYWSQKKAIAPGCEPEMIKTLIDEMGPIVHGQSLAGAGGGGFYFGFLQQPEDRARVETIIKGRDGMTIHKATVDQMGIRLVVGGFEVNIP